MSSVCTRIGGFGRWDHGGYILEWNLANFSTSHPVPTQFRTQFMDFLDIGEKSFSFRNR